MLLKTLDSACGLGPGSVRPFHFAAQRVLISCPGFVVPPCFSLTPSNPPDRPSDMHVLLYFVRTADGYSTSRTCEMSLSNHSGINFRGLVYLVDEATTPKKATAAAAK